MTANGGPFLSLVQPFSSIHKSAVSRSVEKALRNQASASRMGSGTFRSCCFAISGVGSCCQNGALPLSAFKVPFDSVCGFQTLPTCNVISLQPACLLNLFMPTFPDDIRKAESRSAWTLATSCPASLNRTPCSLQSSRLAYPVSSLIAIDARRQQMQASSVSFRWLPPELCFVFPSLFFLFVFVWFASFFWVCVCVCLLASVPVWESARVSVRALRFPPFAYRRYGCALF